MKFYSQQYYQKAIDRLESQVVILQRLVQVYVLRPNQHQLRAIDEVSDDMLEDFLRFRTYQQPVPEQVSEYFKQARDLFGLFRLLLLQVIT